MGPKCWTTMVQDAWQDASGMCNGIGRSMN
jgi:hypothetical protein